MSTPRYETDLTDEQFALVQPLLPRPKRTGRPPADPREVLNAILYLVRTGCQWRRLPRGFPPRSTAPPRDRRGGGARAPGKGETGPRRRGRPPSAGGPPPRRPPR